MPRNKSQDKHSRAVAKATSWRVIATCDTIFLSWLFTGQIGNALRIGATEVVTKIGLFYLHERVWEKVGLGRSIKDGAVQEKHSRSVIKGISWRIFGTLDTILIATFWTGDYKKALAIGGTEVITKVGLYWLHERAWLKIKWGKNKAAAIPEPVPAPLVNTLSVTEEDIAEVQPIREVNRA